MDRSEAPPFGKHRAEGNHDRRDLPESASQGVEPAGAEGRQTREKALIESRGREGRFTRELLHVQSHFACAESISALILMQNTKACGR